MNDKEMALENVITRLNKQKPDKIDILGLMLYVVYCKSLYSKNSDLNEFIKVCFKIDLPLYVLKSRTLIGARISRYIYSLDDSQVVELIYNLKMYFENLDITENNIIIVKKRKRKNENDKLEKWLKGL